MRDLSPPKKPDPDAGKYQPTAREQAVLDKYEAQTAAEKTPRIKVSHNKKAKAISLDHPDRLVGQALLTEALGTVDLDFVSGLLTQLGNATSQDQRPDESAINFLLSVIKGAKPKDQFEAMLAAQMAAIHTATMTFTRRLNHVETIQQQDSAERALNKLARTFVAEVATELMKRNRLMSEDVDWLVPHQANWRIIEATAERMIASAGARDGDDPQIREHDRGDDSAMLMGL